MGTHEDDLSLLEDESALLEWVHKHDRYITAFFKKHAMKAVDAEALCSETFRNFLKKLIKFIPLFATALDTPLSEDTFDSCAPSSVADLGAASEAK